MEPSPYQANELFAKELEDELMKYTDYEIDNKDMSSVQPVDKACGNDIEEIVNIMECSRSTKFLDQGMVEAECLDSETSSSFDDSDCGVDNIDASGESEALSRFHGDADSDVFEEIFSTRKKQLTEHWRSYIRPLAWRCKWVELQIKKMEAQARIYDRKLEEYQQQKQVQLDEARLEEHGVKSLPFSENYGSNEIHSRNKRRRDEETNDLSAYMSKHNLFSYYENKKNYFRRGVFLANIAKNPARTRIEANIDDEQPLCSERGNDDAALEQLYEKITSLQSHVGKLKSRANKVISENTGKFPFDENLILLTPHNASASTSNIAAHPNSASSMPVGPHVVASQVTSGLNMNSVAPPESAVAGHGADVVPDANRSPQRGCVGQGENLLVYSRRGKEKMNMFMGANAQPVQRAVAPSSINPSLIATPPIQWPVAQSSNNPPRLVTQTNTNDAFVAMMPPIHGPVAQSRNKPPRPPRPVVQTRNVPPAVGMPPIQRPPRPIVQSINNHPRPVVVQSSNSLPSVAMPPIPRPDAQNTNNPLAVATPDLPTGE